MTGGQNNKVIKRHGQLVSLFPYYLVNLFSYFFVFLLFCFLIILLPNRIVWAEERVQITADQMEIIKKGEINLFRGNVNLSSEKATITAQQMKHFIPEQKVEAEGDVKFFYTGDSGEETKIQGQEIIYNYKDEYGLIPSTATLFYSQKKKPENDINLTASQIQLFGKDNQICATGDVKVAFGQYQGQSNRLDYFQSINQIELTLNPQIYYQGEDNSAWYSGDKITILLDEEKVIIEGNVKGIIYGSSE